MRFTTALVDHTSHAGVGKTIDGEGLRKIRREWVGRGEEEEERVGEERAR